MNTEQVNRGHILVVEDEPDCAALIESILREGGFSTAVAYHGIEALDRVQEQTPDLITLDIQMPKRSGMLFYRQMKQDDSFRQIPVLIITGLTRQDKDMQTFIHVFLDEIDGLPPPQAYLEKPVDHERLLAVIEKLLHLAKLANQEN